MENQINHEDSLIVEACGINKAAFENKLKSFAEFLNSGKHKPTEVVETLENNFTSRELALLVNKSIEELNQLYDYINRIGK